jgi:hypothetical protein
MTKKIILSGLFATIALITPSLHSYIAEDFSYTITLQKKIDHIEQEIKFIMQHTKATLMLFQKVKLHFKNLLKNDYKPAKAQCLAALTTIVDSEEFITTIDQVTDMQVRMIIDQDYTFEDITVDPALVLPLQRKREAIVISAAFDHNSEQLFNAFYLVIATLRGSQSLIIKLKQQLNAKKNMLTEERAQLYPPDQSIDA